MAKHMQCVDNLDIRDTKPDWEPYLQPKAPEGSPNVLFIVWDDVGFAAMEPWGGLIETPTMNRLAKEGLTYTNMHTTALCSPTRSCLMTGRNHTSNGMACISEAAIGFPNANGHIPFECATVAEVLNENGFNTYMLGKWHLCAEDEMNMASSKRNWPLGRGFERFYGFLGAETNNWYPTWSTITTRSSSPAVQRRMDQKRATTCRLTWRTRPWNSSKTPKPSHPSGPFSCTSALAPATRRITRPRSGLTGTRASLTWATSATASSCSSARSRWVFSQRTRSSRRSIRLARQPRRRAPRVCPSRRWITSSPGTS